jgi:hypothetical protein
VASAIKANSLSVHLMLLAILVLDDYGRRLDRFELLASVLKRGIERGSRVPRFAGRMIRALHLAVDPFSQNLLVNRGEGTTNELRAA